MSRLTKQYEKEQTKTNVTEQPTVQPIIEPIPEPASIFANKKLLVAIFAGISVALGIYSDVIDVSFLQSIFGSGIK